MTRVEELTTKLQLLPHPEGGFFREIYRSSDFSKKEHLPAGYSGDRSYATSIYFLLTAGNFSAYHRILQDEMWHFYEGSPIEIHEIDPSGTHTVTILGTDLDAGQRPFHVVKGGVWFGSRVHGVGAYGLVGCTVAPGFDFADFEMADRQELVDAFPKLEAEIVALTRG